MRFSKTSLAVMAIQLALVSTITAKYLYQRATCPRVWARATVLRGFGPTHGDYLALHLTVNGCQSTLPSAKEAIFPRNLDGTTRPDGFTVRPNGMVWFRAALKVEKNELLAIRLQNPRGAWDGQTVEATPGTGCAEMRLAAPMEFYLDDKARSAEPWKNSQELWVEVTVPPQGPPRPVQMAVKVNGEWRPVAFQ